MHVALDGGLGFGQLGVGGRQFVVPFVAAADPPPGNRRSCGVEGQPKST
jgi:hypothetical protein